MNSDTPRPSGSTVAKWAIRLGAAGFFGRLRMGISKGGGLAFSVGMALPVGLSAVIGGAVVGSVSKAVNK
ncbi:hypothetical protein E4O93_04460 [Diaphorobacter sp. DS2]|nr:hypothetical protein E4O93_04460 [Diaphorobacter sp. DS2]